MVKKTNSAFTMIEVLVVLSIVSIFIITGIYALRGQLAKGRDSKRKADLNKIQNALENYLNDNNCYPAELNFGASLSPYMNIVPRDPIKNTSTNYFYSYDSVTTCKKWYKIYAKLENTNDPVIEKVGCAAGCGPYDGIYNYWVSSPNMNQVAQLKPGELWWPVIGGETQEQVEATPTPVPASSPTPTLEVQVTPTAVPTMPLGTPTPISTLTPIPTDSCVEYEGCGWVCGILPLGCASCCPGTRECVIKDLTPQCCYTEVCPAP